MKIFRHARLASPAIGLRPFLLSLRTLSAPGSGKRYVHGGISLQEVVVPVVKIHKARTDDTERVEVEFMRVPAKITTGQVALSFFQETPDVAKVLPRELRVGVFAKDGTPIFGDKSPNVRLEG